MENLQKNLKERIINNRGQYFYNKITHKFQTHSIMNTLLHNISINNVDNCHKKLINKKFSLIINNQFNIPNNNILLFRISKIRIFLNNNFIKILY